MTSKRILVSAYGCEPGKGSEQGVGWNWVLQLSEIGEIIVVTRANNQEAIEAALSAEIRSRICFIYYDLPKTLRKFKNKDRGLYFYYFLWQWGAYKKMRREIAIKPVDYAMHLTFGSVWMPTFMHRLPVTFIWGPVGGGEAVPWSLIRSLPLKGRLAQYFRYFLIATVAVNPFFMGVTRKSKVILARTEDTKKIFPTRYSGKVKIMLETAAAENWFDRRQKSRAPEPGAALQVIYTGRLVPLKNLLMAIRAVALARRRGADIRFRIVGQGPMQSALEQLAAAEGIDEFVTFTGQCTQDEVFNLLAKSDAYLFPSLKEGGVWSLLEAMALSLPCLCVDTSGMSVIADDSCARLIKPGPVERMVADFADALCEFAANPELRHEMGTNARKRLEREFRWEQKGAYMKALFDDLERGMP